MNFIKNLDYLLEKNEMKKSDLAREINIAPSTISAWYNGKYEKVSLQVLKKLSMYFNVTIDELVNDDLSNCNEIKLIYSSKYFTKQELISIDNFVNLIDSYKEEVYSNDPFKNLEHTKYTKCRLCGKTILINSAIHIKSIKQCNQCKGRTNRKKYESSNLY
jgi:transcriptional regulator with XRE-family HTH domain